MLKHFRGAPTKIYLHENLTHEYFRTRKIPDLRYPLIPLHKDAVIGGLKKFVYVYSFRMQLKFLYVDSFDTTILDI